MSKTIYIGGRLESKEKGNVVTGANAILDDTKGKKQNVINKETDDELLRLEQSKQDNLNFDNAPTENSTNPVTSGGVYTAEKALSDAIEAILLLIPSAATALNKLVDTNTMNSSISTATATFRGTYNAVSDLGLTYQATHAQIEAALDALGLTADNNDFAFVQIPVSDESQDIAKTERFKFNGTNWLYEYDLNTSGFTAAQWAAINSTITLALVQKLAALPTNAELLQALGLKQDVLTFDNAPTTDSNNPVKSGGIKNAIDTAVGNEAIARDNADRALSGLIDDEKTRAEGVEGGLDTRMGAVEGSVSTIEGVIPSEATSSNKLVDNLSMTTYIGTIIDNIDATFNITSTDGHVTLAITQVNGAITSVQLTTSDIASAAVLNLKASQADLTALAGRVTTAEGNINTINGNITLISGRVSTNETDIANLQQLYNNLQQSKPVPVTSLPSSGQQQGVIYRLAGSTSYSDYMWNGSTWVLMATYNNAIDDVPTAGSNNLVKSGGIVSSQQFVTDTSFFDNIKELYLEGISDISLYSLLYYAKNYNFWGVSIMRKSDSTVVASGLIRQEEQPKDGIFVLEESNSSGVKGYAYIVFDSKRGYWPTDMTENALYLGNCPLIIDYQININGNLVATYYDGYYLINGILAYEENSAFAVAAYDISNFIGMVGTIDITTVNMNNQYVNLWGVVDSISVNEPLIVEGAAAGTRTSDTLNIPTEGHYLLVQCKPTEHNTTAFKKINAINDIYSKIANLKNEVDAITISNVDVVLPDTIHAVDGDTLQLFFRGIVKAKNPENYDIRCSCLKGQQFKRYFQYLPVTADVGTTQLKIDVRDNNGNVLGSKSTNIVTVNAPSSPSSLKTVLCFGDSLTSGGQWVKEASRRLTGTGGTPAGKALSNVTFKGKMVSDGVGYFGAGGWNWYNYLISGSYSFRFNVSGVTQVAVNDVYSNNGFQYTVTEVNITEGNGSILCSTSANTNVPESSGTLTKVSGTGDGTITFSEYEIDPSNPLWDAENNKVSFIPYVNTYCNGNVDVVYVMLSWNGLKPYQEDFSAFIDWAKRFINPLHSEYPNAKVKIMGIEVPCPIDMAAYGASGDLDEYSYSDTYAMAVAALNLNKAYQNLANDPSYSSFVDFVCVSAQFDSDYNLPTTDKAVNTRNPETETVCANGVHPNDYGYGQIADAVYRDFVATFCQ